MSVSVLGRFTRFLRQRQIIYCTLYPQDVIKCAISQRKYTQCVKNLQVWQGITGTLQSRRSFSLDEGKTLDPLKYEKLSEETLEELTEYLENCFENVDAKDLDINFSSGVLTIVLGKQLGTYVINKQSPNRQIWLSSPTSGPKRYDFVDGQWVYSHDGSVMHDLIEKELTEALKYKFDLKSLLYYKFMK